MPRYGFSHAAFFEAGFLQKHFLTMHFFSWFSTICREHRDGTTFLAVTI
jgi:hypothetical protein